MATVTVSFEVRDVHIGTDPEEWKYRVRRELGRVQDNSEVGLVLDELSGPVFTDMPIAKRVLRKACKKKIVSRKK